MRTSNSKLTTEGAHELQRHAHYVNEHTTRMVTIARHAKRREPACTSLEYLKRVFVVSRDRRHRSQAARGGKPAAAAVFGGGGDGAFVRALERRDKLRRGPAAARAAVRVAGTGVGKAVGGGGGDGQ